VIARVAPDEQTIDVGSPVTESAGFGLEAAGP
jgi:hypothetical protein